jgi:hypothetical protein
MKKSSMIKKCSNNTGGHERKSSMIKSAQTKLGGMKEFEKAQHWGAPWTILQINSKVQKFTKKKKEFGI